MSRAERPESSLAETEAMSADELVAALSESKILRALRTTDEDLLQVQSDSDLLDTLRITYEVLAALRASGVFDAFMQLPQEDQANFLRVIGMTDDHEVREHRTLTFVAALKESPLGDD